MTPQQPFKQGSLRAAAAKAKQKVPVPVPIPPPVPAAAVVAPKPPGPKIRPAPPPFTGTIPVTFACGHTGEMGIWPDGKDKFRDQRKAKKEQKQCPACREAREKAQMNSKARYNAKRKEMGRLPDKSRFEMSYDAGTTSWYGTLTIPGIPPFTGTASGLFPCCAKLDREYRAWLAAQAPKVEVCSATP